MSRTNYCLCSYLGNMYLQCPFNLSYLYNRVNQFEMQFLSGLFRKTTTEYCKIHDKEAFWVCYDNKCSDCRFICKQTQCNLKHQGHKISYCTQYKENLAYAQKHIKIREELVNNITKYQKNINAYVEKLIEELKFNVFNKINKFCSPIFLEFESQFQNRADFIPLLYNLEKNLPQKLYTAINIALSDKQKNAYKVINKQEINLDKVEMVNNIDPQGNQRQTERKIKAILPFKCELKRKFKASENQFLSKNLHNLNLRGPVVLYVKTHKNRQLGGYSSLMFPKYEQQQIIQNRNITSFIFSLDHNQILPLKEQHKRFAIKGGSNFGFGRGDLLISDECHKGNISWAEIGRAYKEPFNIKGPLNQWLGGASYFRVVQYQIYSVQGKKQK